MITSDLKLSIGRKKLDRIASDSRARRDEHHAGNVPKAEMRELLIGRENP